MIVNLILDMILLRNLIQVFRILIYSLINVKLRVTKVKTKAG